MIIALLTLPLALGFILLARGLRGVAIDDHPLCRNCGFDLTGKPETSTRCSECGADLTPVKSTVIGHRRRRPALIAAGLLLAILSIAGVAARIAVEARTFNIYNYYPNWRLAQLLESSSAQTRTAVSRELVARVNAGKLSALRMDSLADRVLVLQADAKTSWSACWGDVIESILSRGKLSDDRMRRYAAGAISFQLKTRPRVRLGDPLFFSVSRLSPRAANRSLLTFKYENKRVTIGDLQRDWYGSGSAGTYRLDPNMSFVNIPEAIARLKPGPTTLSVSRGVAIAQSSGFGRSFILDSTVTLTAPVTLLPPDEPSVALVPNESLREGVLSSIRIIDTDFHKPYDGLVVQLQIARPPVNVAFDIFILHPGGETKLGAITCAKGHFVTNYFVGHVHELPADTIAFAFRPSIAPATETLDTFEIWDGEIKIESILIRRAATQPAPATRRSSRKAFGF